MLLKLRATQGMVAHACSLSIEEAEAGGLPCIYEVKASLSYCVTISMNNEFYQKLILD